jgi:Zn-dependent M28 family amino/carboxypeptidase
MVMYGAHLDHMGIGDPVNGDRIYNGASDDAAGCASLLETARAFTVLSRAHPPRRKILFLFVTGEERGLLGSKYFAEHPTVPLRDVVADIDIDDAYPIAPIQDVVALGAEESTLAVDAQRAAHALGLETGPDPHPEQNYFIRSDNWSFVKKGIPAAQILRGERGMSKEEKEATEAFWKGRYHQPQDEYEASRDWRPFAEYTKFSFLLGLSIAQRADRPTWNANSFFRRFAEKERAR